MLKNTLKFILLFIFFLTPLFAINNSEIPKSLQDWQSWVLDGVKDKDCPVDFKNNQPRCLYPTTIEVYLDDNGLDFKMLVAVFKEQDSILLPYVYQNWVKELKVDGKEKAVLGDNQAFVLLEKGEHLIEGHFVWKEQPKYLQLPNNMALVSLFKDGKIIQNPKVDAQSRLWLSENQESNSKKGTLSVSIYRKLIDGHPMKMQSYLHFSVSGKMRSVLLDGVVLENFYPSSVTGSLDAKITKDKKLKVQVKAGEWIVNIDSFSPQNILELSVPKHNFNYANQEALSIQSNASYRTIEIVNGQSIDSTQSNIPEEWKSLPLYLLEENRALKIKELYKSVKQQQQNDFLLDREIWLDFDGKGYSIKDTIQADISKVKRLESLGLLELGSVVINSQPMLINTLNNSQQKGVELREQHLKIEASSRYESNGSLIPANGWSEKFNQVTTHLNLPPAWRVFASFGSDSQSSKSWIKEWDLMDIFLVLLITISVFQLFGWKWSLPTAFFLILLWHEQNAPTLIWLWILVLVALLRLLGEMKIKKFIQFLFAFSMIFVLLSVFSFSVNKVRTTLYPQLEKNSYGSTSQSVGRESLDYQYNKMISPSKYKEKASQNYSRVVMAKKMDKMKSIIMQNKIDPNAIIQTGEGIPTWSWKSYTFYWQSTVGLNDKLEIWFITPTMTKALNILNIVGLLFLLWMFLQAFLGTAVKGIKNSLFKKEILQALLLFSLLGGTPLSLEADEIPSTTILNELKSKLLEPPTCLPHCASINSIDIWVKDKRLFVDMYISAGDNISVPILGNRNIWLPQKVSVNNSNKSYLQLDKQGDLWVMLKEGVHKISLSGNIDGINQMMLSSKLPLHNLNIKKSSEWKIKSDNKSYIELINLDKASSKSREKSKSAIEPMVEVTRVFYFGLRWYIETEVKLLNEIDKPYALHYQLLENESVLNKEIEVESHQAILHLRNNHKSYKWRSSLPITPNLHIKASNKNAITEIWKMDISSMWNMHYQGLESEKQFSQNNLLMPTFRPWREENLTLQLEPIKAVKGESLTIESSNLEIVQSQRYRDLTLKLEIKSSRAEQYVIGLENIKELSSLKIDGVDYFLKINNNQLSIPLKGKAQTVVIKWKEEASSQNIYRFSKINLNRESVNSNISLKLPQNRWVLWTNGPLLGPAVLLWGVMLTILIFALILGRVKGSPLKVTDWLLLGLGVSTSSIMILIPIVGWIFLLRFKEQKRDELKGKTRNLIQVMIVILTFITFVSIVVAVSMGLLGNPDMMIQGNDSYGFNLNWYSDRIGESLAQPTVISVSMWYYRVLMLLWAIWISFSLIKWLKWSWKIFSDGDMWVKRKK